MPLLKETAPGRVDGARQLAQQVPCAAVAERVEHAGLGMAPARRGARQRLAAAPRQAYLARPAVVARRDRDQALFLERAQVAGQRGAVHDHGAGEIGDRHGVASVEHGEQRELRRAQAGGLERGVVELGHRARRLAQVEAETGLRCVGRGAHRSCPSVIIGVYTRTRTTFQVSKWEIPTGESAGSYQGSGVAQHGGGILAQRAPRAGEADDEREHEAERRVERHRAGQEVPLDMHHLGDDEIARERAEPGGEQTGGQSDQRELGEVGLGDVATRRAEHLEHDGVVDAPALAGGDRAGDDQDAGRQRHRGDRARRRAELADHPAHAVEQLAQPDRRDIGETLGDRARQRILVGRRGVDRGEIGLGRPLERAGREDDGEVDAQRRPVDDARIGDLGGDVAAQHIDRQRVADRDAEAAGEPRVE